MRIMCQCNQLQGQYFVCVLHGRMPLKWLSSNALTSGAVDAGIDPHPSHLRIPKFVCLFVGCLSSVSQGRICTDNFTCCHTEIEAADQTFHLTQSQYTDTGPTTPSADPITPGAWQGSHWSANFEVTGMTRPRKNPGASGIRTRDLPLSRRMP